MPIIKRNSIKLPTQSPKSHSSKIPTAHLEFPLNLSPTNSLNNRLLLILVVPLSEQHLFHMTTRFVYCAILYGFLLWGLGACSTAPVVTDPDQPAIFFDLAAFFEKEVAHLEERAPKLDKTIQHNDTTERRVVEVEDWAGELRFFSNIDINKPSWMDQYQVDTLKEPYGYQIKYSALNKDLVTQELAIQIVDGQVTFINAIQLIDNQVYQSQRFLEYKPRSYYKIKQLQDVALLSPNDYTIQAMYRYE